MKLFTLAAGLRKLRGMSSDHATVERAVSDSMNELKTEATLTSLGEEKIESMEVEEFLRVLWEWNQKKYEAAGGYEAFMLLTKEEQAARDLDTINAMMKSLGEDAFSMLPEEDQRLLTLFVWSGCCMHKDQNSFKGGNTAMMKAWEELGVPAPIPLANKANAEAVQNIVSPETRSRNPPTDTELMALAASTRGGAKCVALAGAIFNNRYDKKGQGETHIIFLGEQLDAVVRRFPQTNNTRFGSHGEAAGELLARLELYIKFLEHIKTKKVSESWTNIELNVYNALHDPATLTELAVMALYQQVITHPYMRMVRAPEKDALNALDLGPMHVELRDHCQRLIDEPELLLDFDEKGYVDSTFDGLAFTRPDVVEAIKGMAEAGKLPHLKEIFISFLKGALVTWIRFSSEYAPGGLIDGLTDGERKRAFLNPTNDRNEGALGSFCVDMRVNPTQSMNTHNASAMYTRNETREFVDAFFIQEDHQWLLRAARKRDASGMEKARRKEQAEFEQKLVEMKREKKAAKLEKERAFQRTLDATELITAVDQISGLTGKMIDIQLEKLKRRWGTPRIDAGKKSDRVAVKKQTLEKAFKAHLELLKTDTMNLVTSDTNRKDGVTVVNAWHDEEDEEFDED
jgi:hypothetical protein